jgi:hypothetical protein
MHVGDRAVASITAEEAGRRICWAAPHEQLGR